MLLKGFSKFHSSFQVTYPCVKQTKKNCRATTVCSDSKHHFIGFNSGSPSASNQVTATPHLHANGIMFGYMGRRDERKGRNENTALRLFCPCNCVNVSAGSAKERNEAAKRRDATSAAYVRMFSLLDAKELPLQ